MEGKSLSHRTTFSRPRLYFRHAISIPFLLPPSFFNARHSIAQFYYQIQPNSVTKSPHGTTVLYKPRMNGNPYSTTQTLGEGSADYKRLGTLHRGYCLTAHPGRKKPLASPAGRDGPTRSRRDSPRHTGMPAAPLGAAHTLVEKAPAPKVGTRGAGPGRSRPDTLPGNTRAPAEAGRGAQAQRARPATRLGAARPQVLGGEGNGGAPGVGPSRAAPGAGGRPPPARPSVSPPRAAPATSLTAAAYRSRRCCRARFRFPHLPLPRPLPATSALPANPRPPPRPTRLGPDAAQAP